MNTNNIIIETLKKIYRYIRPIRGKHNIIFKRGGVNKAYYFVKGNNNLIQFGKNVHVNRILIRILGNNNKLVIGNNVSIINKDNDYFLIDGNNCCIEIGDNTSIQSAHINAQEDNSSIIIGKGCMMSDGIIIRTSDSHPIYDLQTSERLNNAKSIVIGENVWIAQNSTIMKGVKIGNGAIVGLGSIVTKDIPDNSLAVGVPAKIIKNNIKWESHF